MGYMCPCAVLDGRDRLRPSRGVCHSLLVCLLARDRGCVPVCFVCVSVTSWCGRDITSLWRHGRSPCYCLLMSVECSR
jgi:hypothetical protein